METGFWILLALLAYNHAGYQLLTAAIGIIRQGILRQSGPPDDCIQRCFEPTVSLIIVAHNEEKIIAEKLRNTAALDYPEEKLEVIVASDCSTDDTHRIVLQATQKAVRLCVSPVRVGQTGAQNLAVESATGQILVFSDANSMYHPSALRYLTAHFADPRVGVVIGRITYSNGSDSGVAFGESLYTKYEAWLKRWQSAAGSLLLGNGAIYAVRREAAFPISPEDSRDTLAPLYARIRGYETRYEPNAVAVEKTASAHKDEYRRKGRIVMADLRTLWKHRFLLWKPCHPYLAFHLISHKLLRYAGGGILLGLLCVNAFLLDIRIYRLTMLGQLLFHIIALIGYASERSKRRSLPLLMRLPMYFDLGHLGVTRGVIDTMRGKRAHIWEKVGQTR